MLETKAFEIRDRGTFIPVIAVRLTCKQDDPEHFLLRRAGFNTRKEIPDIILYDLTNDKATYDPFKYDCCTRTLPVAHRHIRDNWDSLNSGDVVDVEFILGETTTCKISERISWGNE